MEQLYFSDLSGSLDTLEADITNIFDIGNVGLCCFRGVDRQNFPQKETL
jgi:hypothetical protein